MLLLSSSFHQQVAPVSNNLLLSALVGLLPLVTVFVLLGVFKVKAWVAALSSLVVAFLVAVLAFKMPVSLAAPATVMGATNGLWIIWIVLMAFFMHQLTVISGRFEDLRVTFGMVSKDPRITAIIVAFCFGALLEGLAGFGAPVAITAVMLIAVGFSPMRASCVALLANTAPVAFGAVGVPVLTASTSSLLDVHNIGAMCGRQVSLLGLIVPTLLLLVVDGKRGLRQAWPFALVVGVAFSASQWITANYIDYTLTDLVASLVALAAGVAFLQVWKPAGTDEALATLKIETERELATVGGGSAVSVKSGAKPGAKPGGTGTNTLERPGDDKPESIGAGRVFMSLAPYLLVVVIFWLAKKWPTFTEFLAGRDKAIKWPGLDGHIFAASGKVSHNIFTWTIISSPGSLLLFTAILVAIMYRISPAKVVSEFGKTFYTLRWTILVVALFLALANVMTTSGQAYTLGKWVAGAGAAFAFLSPILGWFGVMLTGSDTSANALFAGLQVAAGKTAGINTTLLVAANTSGGGAGKMISPQSLTIAASVTGMVGQEAQVLRKVLYWSIGLLLLMCVLVFLQSNVLSAMVV